MIPKSDKRLIEHGFPCHQVGAETQRERGASSALPPLYFLHVWWARRPLTPSRAAILASLLPANYPPDLFLRRLGIEKVVVDINGWSWTLTGGLRDLVTTNHRGEEVIEVDDKVRRAIEKEIDRRAKVRSVISKLKNSDSELAGDMVLLRWEQENETMSPPLPHSGETFLVQRVMADPAQVKARIQLASSPKVVHALGSRIKLDSEDLYGYGRAFMNDLPYKQNGLTVLDPTAGGGSIPFEALRLGYNVIANELNPVATVILYATLDYPARYGLGLVEDIKKYGAKLLAYVQKHMEGFAPFSPLPEEERNYLKDYLKKCPEFFPQFDVPEYDHVGLIYARQVTCPHCRGEAPLLNSCWLSKEAGDTWGVEVKTDGKSQGGKVSFATYRVAKGRGPQGQDPNFATVNDAVGTCVHCKQAISGDEIKTQARGESPLGQWQDRLYCVVAVRFEPVLDKHGKPVRYASGEKKGEIKTRKVRFFRPPNDRDRAALIAAEARLQEKWPEWEDQGLIPTEKVPEGHKTLEPLRYGMPRWCDMFTPRQLLGHLTLVEGLRNLTPEILTRLGEERGRAVATYLQFAIDKGVDYNTRQNLWDGTRGVRHAFTRHDFSIKWCFAEMIFTGPNSGASWGLSQVVDSYAGIATLLDAVHEQMKKDAELPITVLRGDAAHLSQVADRSVDLVCIDPPYYNNVQYAELSDYFYIWQKRTLKDLYPGLFTRRVTDKKREAVANPARDGSAKGAKAAYERMMGDIFAECHRVLKDEGLLTLMFTHKSHDAWEALTRSLIENHWTITATFPIESEPSQDIHHKDVAAAASSIFLSCRKRLGEPDLPATWTGLGGGGVQHQIRRAVEEGLTEFIPLKLNPVDRMVACYGRALRVLSENWPVLDGDEPVGPIRAMDESSRVVAEQQVRDITNGRLSVDDLDSETAMALTLFGIWGLLEFPFHEALNLSKSLNIPMVNKSGGYRLEGRMIGVNQSTPGGRSRRDKAEVMGFHAPVVGKGSKLRLARPEERNEARLSAPQTDWDVLQGLIMAYRKGDIPVARSYLTQHAGDHQGLVLDLLRVWAAEVDDPDLKKEGESILFGFRG
jgi:putative DNA methylase